MPFPWNDIEGTYREEILDFYKMLGRMRLEEEAIDGGDFYVLSHTDSAMAFVREKNDSKLTVIVNRGDEFTLELDGEHEYRSLESGEIFTSSVRVCSDSVLILKELH